MKTGHLFGLAIIAVVLFTLSSLITPCAHARIAPTSTVSGDPTNDEGPQAGPKKTQSSPVLSGAGFTKNVRSFALPRSFWLSVLLRVWLSSARS